ncbi:MAG TPA: DUF302 domain-containing protein [Terriglobales bacterium]|nr:DUF302 domain-containing protein [Terriglobales bacterium]
MTYTKTSLRTLPEVEDRLRQAAQAHKFGVLNVLDIQQTLKSKGIEMQTPCRIFDVCNPQAASQALSQDMRVSVVLPCRISVFQDGQKVTLATVNPTDLIGATGISGAEILASHIEKELKAIIDEAAA